jgi:hypothetical protein
MPDPFPTMEQVDKADREQIARWHCYLAAPRSASEQDIADRIADRCLNMGGLTPGLSAKIGFSQPQTIPTPTRVPASDTLRLADKRRSHAQSSRLELKPAPNALSYKSPRLLKAS